MAGTKAPKERAPHRHWPKADKRRIVELTLRPGASLVAIAGEHDVDPNNLYRWKRLYRAGKLDAAVKSTAHVADPAASATFMPVSVVPEMRSAGLSRQRAVPQMPARPDESASGSSVVQLVLATGATLRLETRALDAAFVCALVAELQR
jgi:transposase